MAYDNKQLCGCPLNFMTNEIEHRADCMQHRFKLAEQRVPKIEKAIDDLAAAAKREPVETLKTRPWTPPTFPLPETPPENVRSLAAARFDRVSHPAELGPRAALEKALEWVDECEGADKPAHIIVMIGKNCEAAGASGTKFFQAGEYRHHAQMGLCLEAMHMIRESGKQ